MQSITIDKRYCGPPNSANGGYVCGMLARAIGRSAEITLRAPPPLGRPLAIVTGADGAAELRDQQIVLATGRPVQLDVTEIPAASFLEAEAAARESPYANENTHTIPGCFVCGPGRAAGDGLRIFVGSLPMNSIREVETFAAPWVPPADLAGDDGHIASEFVWAALDCPTGGACVGAHHLGVRGDEHILLGRMAAQIDQCPMPGDQCVLVAWATGRDGRKLFASSALLGPGGAVLAIAKATWLIVDPQAVLRQG
jgi:hypothetical protein